MTKSWKEKQIEAVAARAKALARLKENGALSTLPNQKLKAKTFTSTDNTFELLRKRKIEASTRNTKISTKHEVSSSTKKETKEAIPRKEKDSMDITNQAVSQVVEAGDSSKMTQTEKLPVGWQSFSLSHSGGQAYLHNSSGCVISSSFFHALKQAHKLEGKGYLDRSEKEEIRLLVGWKSILDPKTNKIYYWDVKTGKTQWLIPQK